MTETADPLFREAAPNEWRKNAVVGWLHEPQILYMDGYLEAASILTERALDGHFADTLVYPIGFLLRHAVEMTLKQITRELEKLIRLRAEHESELQGQACPDAEVVDKLERTHKLQDLFDSFVSRLGVADAEAAADIPAEVVSTISELHKRDQTGEAFRYAWKKKSRERTFDKQERIDLENFVEKLRAALRYLSGLDCWLGSQVDFCLDYEAELRSQGGWQEAL